MFTIDFYQRLLLAVVGVSLGGIALWTWQRMYWEYQLRRQTEDWKLRQCYSRRDSQRLAMEALLVEMNRALEDFVTATLLVASSIQRRHNYRQRGGTEEGIKKWNQEVHKSAEQFNESEREWLAQSRVISGKIALHFNDSSGEFVSLWEGIVRQSEGTCNLLNNNYITMGDIWNAMLKLRNKKKELLELLQKRIDGFVSEELEFHIVE